MVSLSSLRMASVAIPLFLLLFSSGPVQAFEAVEIVSAHGKSATYSLDEAALRFGKRIVEEQHEAAGITFYIDYEDHNAGFFDPVYGDTARQTLYAVLDYVAAVLDYPGGEIDLQVMASEFDGSGAIASAGTPFPIAPGIHPGATLHRLNTGEKLAEAVPEITLMVDFGWPFALGSEPPQSDEFDLHTVLLHEVTHGIGFSTRIGSTGGSTSFIGGYSIFDAMLTDRSGVPLLATDGPVPVFQANPAILTRFDVAFSGTYAMAQFGTGAPVPVFASPPFRRGTSIAHWAFLSVAGDVLMEPRLNMGAMQRVYTPQDIGAVIDLKNFSRGDGQPGDGPVGCHAPAAPAPARSAGSSLVLLGSLLLLLLEARRGWTAREQRVCRDKRGKVG